MTIDSYYIRLSSDVIKQERTMRIHLIGNRHIITSRRYTTDAFTQLAIKFARMWHRRHHTVYYYGVTENVRTIPCSYHEPLLRRKDYSRVKSITNDFSDPAYMVVGIHQYDRMKKKIDRQYWPRLKKRLEANYQPGDIVVHICDDYREANFSIPMIHVTCSQMGGEICQEHTVFITAEWQKHFEIIQRNQLKFRHGFVPMWAYSRDSKVILPWFEPKDFTYQEKRPPNTYLYLARCQNMKGLNYFLRFAMARPQAKFLIAGGCHSYDSDTKVMMTGEPGVTYDLHDYPNVEYRGIVDSEGRKKLLTEVTAVIQPTPYVEPCGWNVIEAMMSGCPVLAPKYGGFINTVRHGVTGFLCDGDDWLIYLDHIGAIRPQDCRDHAISTFSEERAYQQYRTYFEDIQNDFLKEHVVKE